jgi:hypothetical protein
MWECFLNINAHIRNTVQVPYETIANELLEVFITSELIKFKGYNVYCRVLYWYIHGSLKKN